MRKRLAKAGKIGAVLLLILLGLTAVLWLAIQQPRVQQKLTDLVTRELGRRLDTHFEVGKLRISFFRSIELENFYLEDQQQDTLLAIGRLEARLGLFSLLGQEIDIELISLADTKVRLRRTSADSSYNFQFLLDALASEPSPSRSDVPSPLAWRIGLGNLQVRRLDFSLRDSLAEQYADLYLGKLDATTENFDLAEKVFHLASLTISDTRGRYALRPAAAADTASATVTFPDPGWQLALDQLTIDNFHGQYDQLGSPPQAGRIDPGHLLLSGLDLDLTDLVWTGDSLDAALRHLAVEEQQSGLTLTTLSARLHADRERIDVRDLNIRTPESRLRHDLRASFDYFADLSDFVRKVNLDLDLHSGQLALADLRLILGDSLGPLDLTRPGQIRWSGKISGTTADLSFDRLRIELEQATALQVSGSLQGLPDPAALQFDFPRFSVNTAYQALHLYAPGLSIPAALESLGQMRLTGDLRGRPDNLRADSLLLTTQTTTRAELALAVRGLPQIDSTFLLLKIKKLQTRARDWAGFMNGETPPAFDSLGLIQFTGRFDGLLTDLESSGQLTTQAGDLRYDLQSTFTPDFQDPRYSGQVEAEGLALQTILGDTANWGPLSLRAQFAGRGLKPDSLQLDLDSRISSLIFRHYPYRDLQLQAAVDGQTLTSSLVVSDPHLSLDLQGQVGWQDSLLSLTLTGQVDTAHLHQLNLYQDTLNVQAGIQLDFPQLSADYPAGNLLLTNLRLSRPGASFQTDSLLLAAEQLTGGRSRLALRSEFGRARLEGQYAISHLPLALAGFVDRHFSLAPVSDPAGLDSILRDTRFDLTVSLSAPDRLLQLFVAPQVDLDTAYLRVTFDGRQPALTLTGRLPSLQYGSARLDSITLDGKEENRLFLANLAVASIHPGEGLPALHPSVGLQIGRDSLRCVFQLDADNLGQLYALEALVRPRDSSYYRLTFFEPFLFSNAEWTIDPAHFLDFGPGYLNVSNLRFAKGAETFYLHSRSAADSSSIQPLEIGFSAYQLTNLSRLVRLDSAFLTGQLDGLVLIDQPDGSRLDLRAQDLTLNGRQAGELTVQVEPETESSRLRVATELYGPSGRVAVQGHYATDLREADLELEIDRLAMPLIDALTPGIIRDSRGAITGTFQINGPLNQPAVTGEIILDTVGTFVEYLQLRYQTEGRHRISIDDHRIDLGQLTMYDEAGRQARLEGTVQHDNFNDFRFFLDFQTRAFPFLRTSGADTSLFYGTILLSADAQIRGTPNLPRVSVRATTLDSTLLVLQPLTEQEAITRRDYIIYGAPPPPGADSTAEREAATIQAQGGIELSLLLEVTPQAELQVIIDPATGEKLTARGQASISVEMDQAGNLRTTGSYELTEGRYLLNYEGLLKKSFRIQPGSRITLLGDPLQSRFDVTAVYATRPQPYSLLSQQATLTAEEAAAARRRIDVEVLLQMKGTLQDLELSFDIRVPESARSATADDLRRRLAQIKNDPNDLNTQVFGLLLFDSFITNQNNQSSLAGAGENIALSSVSNLISNQLNQLADRYIKGVELDIGLESYKSGPGGDATVTELQVGLSKRLFDDRLSVKVGGNVDLESNQESDPLTAFAGDFVLEYQLTEDGRYLLRVFSRYDYDLLNGENVNERGIGIMYKKAFGGPRKKKKER